MSRFEGRLQRLEREADKAEPQQPLVVVTDPNFYGNSARLPMMGGAHECRGWYGASCEICEEAGRQSDSESGTHDAKSR
jgi:hypothetical protein